MNIQKEKTIKINFNSFLSIAGIQKIVNKFKSDPRESIIKQADFLIKTNNYESYTAMLKKGYYPTQAQQEKIDDYISNILSIPPIGLSNKSLVLYEELESLLAKGLQLSYKNVARFVRNDFNEINKEDDLGGLWGNTKALYDADYVISGTDTLSQDYDKYVKFPCLTKQFQKIIHDPEFSDYLLKEFKQSLKTKFPKCEVLRIPTEKSIKFNATTKERSAHHTLYRYENILNYAPQLLFKNTKFAEVSSIVENLHYKDIAHKHTTILSNLINKLYKKDLENIFENTKVNFSNNLVQNLTVDTIHNEQYSIKDLPKTALNLITEIESLYKKIKENNLDDIDRLHTLNVLLEKRLPEILSKYLKVDPEYRTTLKSSQGKNAQDLMIDSLENIKNSFITVFEEINQNTVNSLSATNRYTQSIKM